MRSEQRSWTILLREERFCGFASSNEEQDRSTNQMFTARLESSKDPIAVVTRSWCTGQPQSGSSIGL
jgi:hypothetical protein